MSYIGLAGWNEDQMCEGLSGILNLAAASEMDLASASDSEMLVDKMAYAMSNSNTTTAQLGEAYKNCAATATQLGYDLDDTTAALMVMADSKSQKGAYKILANAKKCADKYEGYSVFDADGNVVYVGALTASDASESAETESFQVKVSISNLNIRVGPGTGFAKTGKYTGKGVFTIVETSEGTGSAAGWGLLKAYQSGRDGWISLEFCERT